MATGTNNNGGAQVAVNLNAESDEGAVLFLTVEDDETLEELASVIFTDPDDVDEFLSEVTEAVERFKALKAGATTPVTGSKKAGA